MYVRANRVVRVSRDCLSLIVPLPQHFPRHAYMLYVYIYGVCELRMVRAMRCMVKQRVVLFAEDVLQVITLKGFEV